MAGGRFRRIRSAEPACYDDANNGMSRIGSVLMLAASIVVSSPSFGQEFTEKVEVRVIEVPVHVLDASGNAIRGLARDDFELRINGNKHPIEFFDLLDLEQPRVDSAGDDRSPRRIRRRTLILFDLVFGSLRGVVLGAEATEDYVRRVHPDDLIAIASYRTRGVEFLTPFTRDRALAIRAIRTLTAPQTGDPLRLTIDPKLRASIGTDPTDPENRDESTEGDPGWLGEQPLSTDELGNFGPTPIGSDEALMSELAADHGRRFIRAQIASLESVAADLATLDGQTQILFLSEGFESNLLLRDSRTSQEFYAMQNEYRQHGIVIHTLSTATIGRTLTTDKGQSLFAVANDTGGLALANRNQIAKHFDTFRRSQRVTYLIGFRPPPDTRPGYNQIDVRLRQKGQAARILSRPGFQGVLDPVEHTDNAINLQLAETVLNDIPRHDVRLSVSASSSSKGAIVNVTMPASDLLAADDPRDVKAWLLNYIFEDGQVRDMKWKHLGVDLLQTRDALEKEGQAFEQARFGFQETFDLPPGRYVVKSLFRMTRENLIGVASTELEVRGSRR